MTAPVRPDQQAVDSLPPLHRILSPDEFHAARSMSAEALATRPFPLLPPPAPKESTRVGMEPKNPNPPTDLPTRVAGAIGGMIEHPVQTLAAPLIAFQRQIQKAESMDPQAAQGMFGLPKANPAPTYGKQDVADVAMIAAPLIAGPIAGKVTEALAPLIGASAAHALTQVGLGAGVGAVANPEDPAVGAIIGGTLGAANAKATKAPVSALEAMPAEQRPYFQQQIQNVHDAIQEVFAPDTRGPESARTAGIMRARTGEQAAKYEQASYHLDQFRRLIDPLPDAEKLAFIDAVEGGKSQPTPELKDVAAAIRTTLDDARTAVQNLGTGKLENFIENYFPHIWEDPEKAKLVLSQPEEAPAIPDMSIPEARAAGVDAVQTGAPNPFPPNSTQYHAFKAGLESKDGVTVSSGAVAQSAEALSKAKAIAGSKRPLEGSKSFLKQRTIPTTAEGIAKGLKPVTTNPIDLTLLKVREMQRYVMAHQTLMDMKDAGLIKYVRSGDIPEPGYTLLNDKIATVFGPREGAVTLPEGANIAPEQVGVPGMRIMGQYYAPEPAAKIFNNYLSPGFGGQGTAVRALYDAYRGWGNMLNQAQLGFSAFHMAVTSLESIISRNALGLEYLESGKPLEAATAIASAPLAPMTNAMKGARVRGAYLDPKGEELVQVGNAFVKRNQIPDQMWTPDELALANAVQRAGGRVRMDSFYRNSAPEKMVTAWKAGRPIAAAGYSIPAALELAAQPIMEHVVPVQKLGIFADLAKKALGDLPDEATLADRDAAVAKVWDSVDNRMGQLVYDNLFWSKTFKDLSMASVRSVGWNLGTIRELFGGSVDLAKAVKAKAQGEAAQMTHRANYAVMLPVTVGMAGAVYQYLRTGQGPQELKDYFYPKTGEVDADGNPERVQLKSYWGDVVSYANDPFATLKHKANPLPNLVLEMLNNENYYGDEIRNPLDPFVKQVAQEAKFVGDEVLPFSLTNMLESNARGDQSTATKIGNWFGVTPAPRRMVRTDAQNRMQDYLAQNRMVGTTPEDAAARQARARILAGLRGNGSINVEDAISEAVSQYDLTPKDLQRLLKQAGMTPAQAKFKRLTLEQALDVFKLANDREKGLFAEALARKLERAAK